jgi:hypothetical protein
LEFENTKVKKFFGDRFGVPKGKESKNRGKRIAKVDTKVKRFQDWSTQSSLYNFN